MRLAVHLQKDSLRPCQKITIDTLGLADLAKTTLDASQYYREQNMMRSVNKRLFMGVHWRPHLGALWDPFRL